MRTCIFRRSGDKMRVLAGVLSRMDSSRIICRMEEYTQEARRQRGSCERMEELYGRKDDYI